MHVRMLFVNVRSAFNTIIPMVNKRGPLGLNTQLCNWILDILSERPQFVRVGGKTSSTISLSTGSLQGVSWLLYCSPWWPRVTWWPMTVVQSQVQITSLSKWMTVVGLIQKKLETTYREKVDIVSTTFSWKKQGNSDRFQKNTALQ